MSTALQVHEPPPASQQVAVVQRPATALVRPAANPAVMVEVHKEVTQLIRECLEDGRDYGKIPGAGDKPTLLKPGAERLAIAFGTFPRYEIVQQEIDHDREVTWIKRKKKWRNQFKGDREFTWEEERGTSLGLYRYVVRCTLVRREDGAVVAEGIGSCSTMESKYIDRPRDCENTALKMAEKRGFIAAALNGFGLSDRFTQDVEDMREVLDDRAAAQTQGNGNGGGESRGNGSRGDDARAGAGDGTMPFGDFKGQPVDDPAVSFNYLATAVHWVLEDEEKSQKMSAFADAGVAELLRRIPVTADDELKKVIAWILKKPERQRTLGSLAAQMDEELGARAKAVERARDLSPGAVQDAVAPGAEKPAARRAKQGEPGPVTLGAPLPGEDPDDIFGSREAGARAPRSSMDPA